MPRRREIDTYTGRGICGQLGIERPPFKWAVRVFHITGPKTAAAILRDGFRDGEVGRHWAPVDQGIWLPAPPFAAASLGARRELRLLAVALPEDALGVEPGDLPNAFEGRAVGEGAVGAPLVVVAHPVWQRGATGLA